LLFFGSLIKTALFAFFEKCSLRKTASAFIRFLKIGLETAQKCADRNLRTRMNTGFGETAKDGLQFQTP
jgi:hypothetical protein